jgi:phosphopentomutase
METTIAMLEKDFTGLCFTNLVDFDALYGHRRDVDGYAKAIEEFDAQLGTFISKMEDDCLLMVVADHGNDPIHQGTDHTREYVPLLIYANNWQPEVLPTQKSLGCVAQTIADNFKIQKPKIGTSLLK